MALNEYSDRALSLTTDIITMNPAHYTVWLYRAKCLKEINHYQNRTQASTEPTPDLTWIHTELIWLNALSLKNLKNYQIWHHRRSLVDLLPTLPPKEPDFLTSILSLDTKNIHVWTYRSWLCTRFPQDLLHNDTELLRTETLIDEDVHNNSAWNHRWFLVFGAADLAWAEKHNKGIGGPKAGPGAGPPVEEETIERELSYTHSKISLAPQNLSSWTYLRGLLRRAALPLSSQESFPLTFVGVNGDVRSIDPAQVSDAANTRERVAVAPSGERGVRSSHAVEMLAEIWGSRGGEGDRERAAVAWEMLGTTWDPVRRNYWEYRRKTLEAAEA